MDAVFSRSSLGILGGPLTAAPWVGLMDQTCVPSQAAENHPKIISGVLFPWFRTVLVSDTEITLLSEVPLLGHYSKGIPLSSLIKTSCSYFKKKIISRGAAFLYFFILKVWTHSQELSLPVPQGSIETYVGAGVAQLSRWGPAPGFLYLPSWQGWPFPAL